MTFDEFMRYVRLLGNQTWVRYYLMERPGEIVLEVAKPAHEWSTGDRLDADLEEHGFKRLPFNGYSGWTLRRWSIKRIEAERAEGG